MDLTFSTVESDDFSSREWLLFDHLDEYMVPGEDIPEGDYTEDEIVELINSKYFGQLMQTILSGRYFFVTGFGWSEDRHEWVWSGDSLDGDDRIATVWPFIVDSQGPGKEMD